MNNSEHDHKHYVAPLNLYFKVFGGLIFLTLLTVLTSLYNFGIMNIVIAMLIAVIKATLVVLFFMQLKVDKLENKVLFVSAFVFLFIFIALTGSDLFFRHNPEPVKVEGGVVEATPSEINVLRLATPELVAKGHEIFQTQCISCHGAEGKGNGDASGGMNPPPRNFTTGYWRFGGAPTQIFHTITNGSPGTNMASYANLPTADRYALVHFVRSLSPIHPDDDGKTLAAAGLTGMTSGTGTEKPKQSVPVDLAMEQLEIPDQIILPQDSELVNKREEEGPGSRLFSKNCVSCHGVNGAGELSMALGQNPQTNVITRTFAQLKFDNKTQQLKPWVNSESAFISMVSTGMPGRTMPGMSNYSDREWSDLYTYVKKLTTEP